MNAKYYVSELPTIVSFIDDKGRREIIYGKLMYADSSDDVLLLAIETPLKKLFICDVECLSYPKPRKEKRK